MMKKLSLQILACIRIFVVQRTCAVHASRVLKADFTSEATRKYNPSTYKYYLVCGDYKNHVGRMGTVHRPSSACRQHSDERLILNRTCTRHRWDLYNCDVFMCLYDVQCAWSGALSMAQDAYYQVDMQQAVWLCREEASQVCTCTLLWSAW